MPPALQAIGITKRFPGVLANDHVDFELEHGQIHALLGENGAGKSTLMNILYGLHKPDGGQIRIGGRPVHLSSPHDAIALGIGMVHQHFMLVPPLTVCENMMLGEESVMSGTKWLGMLATLDRRAVAGRVRELSRQYGLDIEPDAYVRDLPVGVQQRVEIIKALYRSANILIMDEPTAVLTPQEADDLFAMMRRLTEQGKSIVFISHKLREVLAVADTISVMREGHMVGSVKPAEATAEQLAEMMVGRKVTLAAEKSVAKAGEPVLSVEGLRVLDDRGHLVVDGVSFTVRAGEILGVAGVQGNGQTELAEAITGLRRVLGGSVRVSGQETTDSTPRYIRQTGVAHVPEERHKYGLVLPFSVRDNLILCTYYLNPFASGVEMDFSLANRQAEELVRTFDIRTPGVETPVSSLSGGNQQKVIVAREMARPASLLIVNQPTRGLDVGSVEFIHQRVLAAREAGAAVLLISAELDEIMTLSDRIAVMYKGRIIGIAEAASAAREGLGLLMAGIAEERANA